MAKAKIYLYKEGNECTSITGGWEYVAFDYEGETLISKKTNYIHHSRTTDSAIRGLLYTKNALNTDNFDKAISEYNIISQTTAGNTNGINFISSRTVGSSGYDYSVDYGIDLGDNITEVAFANNMHVCIRQGGNWGTRINANTYNIYLTSKDDLLIINSQDDDIITFSVNNLDFITISKIDVLVNGIISQTYNGEYSNLSYKVDETLCHAVNNDIEIKVTYSQGDGIVETVSEYLTYTVPKLSTKTPLLDVTKRVVLLTKMKQNEKTILSNILTSKNVEVTEKYKMLDLINKVGNIDTVFNIASSDNEILNIGWNNKTMYFPINNSTNKNTDIFRSVLAFKGCLTVSFKFNSYGAPSYIYIELIKNNGGTESSEYYIPNNNTQTIVKEFEVEKGDVLLIRNLFSSSTASATGYVYWIKLLGDEI